MTWRNWGSFTASAHLSAWRSLPCWRHSPIKNFIQPRQSRRRTQMKSNSNLLTKLVCGLVLGCGMAAGAALPAEWQHAQDFTITAPGLVKISLPVETMDAARPALEDLRLC